MRRTGVIRRIDELHRVTIPKEMCRQLGLAEGAPLEIFLENDGIVMKKYVVADDIKIYVKEIEDMIKCNDVMPDAQKEAACGALAVFLNICALEGAKRAGTEV